MSKTEQKTVEHKHCAECGEELFNFQAEAENVKVLHYDHSGGGTWWELGNPFDKKTGDRNYADVYQCPQFKSGLFGQNAHDIFCVYKGESYYGIKL